MTPVIDIRRSYKYRLYRHDDNRYLVNMIDTLGINCNHILSLQNRYYRPIGGYVLLFRLQRHIAKLRKNSPRIAALSPGGEGEQSPEPGSLV